MPSENVHVLIVMPDNDLRAEVMTQIRGSFNQKATFDVYASQAEAQELKDKPPSYLFAVVANEQPLKETLSFIANLSLPVMGIAGKNADGSTNGFIYDEDKKTVRHIPMNKGSWRQRYHAPPLSIS